MHGRPDGGCAGGAGPPAALAQNERVRGVGQDEAKLVVHAATAMGACSSENGHG